MSEHSFSTEQDELASAYLDDHVTLEERARVEGDPALLIRVEELRSVRDALATPVESPSAEAREAAIQTASRASNVVDLDIASARRRLRVFSIAAAILLVLGAAGLLIRTVGSQSEDKFQTVAGAIGSAAGGPTAEKATQAGGSATGSAFSTTDRPVLGSFTDRSSLAAAAQTQVHSPTVKQADAAGAPAAADSPTTTTPMCLVPSPPNATNEIYAATAVLQGRVVQVDVFTLADGSLMLVVTDAASCAQVFTQPV
jgi:hypothetical protein